ncbi:hypothetical protein DACRYDRAFT_108526 [Dacryopinax primogenitus]|uniref:NAD(P)-binding domain-containing protein n=1 Tax=Dacryopinax primogenitus (strain DJM 731) TaxID=1858805 RepID=M5FZB2_DACPD|nr:uncharacterized protein DACRYDRAFT_108526 [Dacryopinax primogenitus]EJU01195.1 hypothetical protein DACRYDRAFT_108526 [Dacryopinax primogenitus]
MSTQNVLFIGASRGCGFYAALPVLKSGGRATFLLRNPDTFTSNPEFQALTPEQKDNAVLVKGDAYVREDVARAVDRAGEGMNTVVFSLGVRPTSFPKITWSRGFILDPPHPCARAITILLSVLQDLNRTGLRLVIISSMGLGGKYIELPFLLRGWLYGWLLEDAHIDKEAYEYISLRSSKHPTPTHVPEQESIPTDAASLRSDWLDELVIVRPALLTDGKEYPGKVRTAPVVKGAYYLSRRDVGAFIARECLKGENKWVGENGVVLAY